MVCIPLGRDQHLNGARGAAVGAGVALASDADSMEIRNALDQVLADPSYRRAAEAMASASAAAGSAAAVVDDLESFVHT